MIVRVAPRAEEGEPDSDGDGLPDPEDPQPTVPSQQGVEKKIPSQIPTLPGFRGIPLAWLAAIFLGVALVVGVAPEAAEIPRGLTPPRPPS